MIRLTKRLAYLGAGILFGQAQVEAANVTLGEPAATSETVARQAPPAAVEDSFWKRAELTGDWGGLRNTLEDDGFKITPSFTTIVQGNPVGGMKQGVVEDGYFDLQLDFDLEKMSDGAIKGLVFHANALYIYGPNLSTENIGDFSGVTNFAAYNSIRLQEFWFEKSFFNEKLYIRVGNMALDNDFLVSTNTSLYLNGTICTLLAPVILNVANLPAYPVASPGVRVYLEPTPEIYVMSGVYGMDIHSNFATNNRYGTRFALSQGSGVLVMSETGYMLNQQPKDTGLQGTYRIGSFVHTANYDTLSSQAQNKAGVGSLQSAGTNYGIYGLVEQQVYADGPQSVSLFLGGGGAPSYVNLNPWSLEAGCNMAGFLPGRPKDVAGLAFIRSTTSPNLSDAQVALGGPALSTQYVAEATYLVQVAPWWTVQPDIQYVTRPGGVEGSHNALVLGMSTAVTF